ncbi:hypothetical protein BBI01_17795 [Chryseobacterium artocarpi]|uniref:NACHT domain-containing protein n=1 Tax=Chryseobacterium artocarpi TaxID=1414727 RepID=A0A1B8ZBV6_9FLAO|nr:hypothetical protein [Chryseobacterium artocarpi]OCA69065.1 hypothetical protein BBI01_17795 [Chryseobacterium artocarpi]
MEGSASQAGFYYQNNVAALKIIECLFFNSDILQVRLENYEEGNHIDDIIIYRHSKIEYFQVKWALDEEKTYTIYSMLKSEKNDEGKILKKSLFKQLAEGYQSVKNTGKDFSITLFTTKKESNVKRPSEDINFGLTDLRNNIIDRLDDSNQLKNLAVYDDYKVVLSKIQNECSLDDNSFNEFLRCLDFKFRQDSIEEIQNSIKYKLETLGIETELFEKLINAVVKWCISGEKITKDLVLKELGILDRFDDKLSHYFKVVDDESYVSNESFFEKLRSSLTQLSNGYIFIEGLPGIGKSTALTKFKEEEPSSILAYYCFIPDVSNNFGELRHKSSYFLKSLCISIEKYFPDVDLPGLFSTNFEEKLIRYLDKLSSLNKKIIFIVDGLDHVHRDTTIGDGSLLNVIKGALPENIFFILSSQYSSLLSPSVKQIIDSDSRRHIVVNPFSQPEILEYLNKKGIQSPEFIDIIERVSGGIPVYLHYISEVLLKEDSNNYESVLKDFPVLKNGEINYYHDYLFQKIVDDSLSKWVLAVLAYRKENTSLETLHQILVLAGENRPITEVENIVNRFSYLLKQIDGRSFSIFHNSFREFIISKTLDLKNKFNNALVNFYRINPFSDEAFRNYFKHLYEIGDYDTIITSTTSEWVKASWENYRGQNEIEDNLDIAMKATIEKASLSEFTRIAFIKDQFAQAKDNLGHSGIDFTMLLLNSGHTANSLRTIWDGDFVLTSKEYFCHYIGKYYQKTGNILPAAVIKQGFSKSMIDKSVKNLTIQYKAEALVKDNILEIFDNIDKIKWVQSNRNNRSFKRKYYPEEANRKTNTKIKLEILDYLVEHNQSKKLFLLRTKLLDSEFYPEVEIAVIKLLLSIPAQKKEAVTLLKKVDFSKFSDNRYLKLIVLCTKFFSNKEMLELFPYRDMPAPKLFDNVVDDKHNKYELREEIILLFNNLKYFWIFNPNVVEELRIDASYFDSPAEEIYDSIFALSKIWNDNRSANCDEDDLLASLEESIDTLYIPRPKEFRPRARGLFDMDTDKSFISSGIKYLFKNIFAVANETLSKERIEKLVIFWIDKDKSGDGFRHYSVGLQIAKTLSTNQRFNFEDIIFKLLKYAEEVARIEHDTVSLTTYLGKVCDAYGRMRFNDDFKRLYSQILDTAFGLGYRKDYRSTNIIEPLKMIHELDPDGTLKRLEDVFYTQNQLNNAGNGRMEHISISNLIAFAIQIYPSLGFKLMELEESSISRNEAFKIIIGSLITKSGKDELKLFLALIKTLQRWRDASSSESTFLDLAKKLLLKAIEYSDDQLIFEILDIVKFNALIELEDRNVLPAFANILQQNGISLVEFGLEEYIEINPANSSRKNKNAEVSTNIESTVQTIESINQLFTENYDEFNAFLEQEFKEKRFNRKANLLKKERRNINKLFTDFYKSFLSNDQKLVIDKSKYVIAKQYENLKNEILNAPEGNNAFKEFEKLFFNFVNEIDNLFNEATFLRYLQKDIDLDGWLRNIFKNINWRHDHIFYQVLTDSDVMYLVDNCSIFEIDKILDFVNKWTSRSIRSAALLKIANKIMPVDFERAKNVISQVSEYEFDSLLFQHEESTNLLDFDIFQTTFNSNANYGKTFLLKSYYTQKGKYSGDLTGSLGKLFKYKEYFEDNTVNSYYIGNLSFNKGLAYGLPEVENHYGFLVEHTETLSFSEIVINHLVWLFNYPAVKIRELSLQSLFDLISEDDDLLSVFIQRSLNNGNSNEIEWGIVLIHAIALHNPKIITKYKEKFIKLLSHEHVNIAETMKDVLLTIENSEGLFLTDIEKQIIDNVNSASRLILNSEDIVLPSKSKFIYSSFQYDLMYKLNEMDNEENFFESVHSEVILKGWKDYDQENESNVHQRYNINSNFDVIEVQSPYYDALKETINRVFHKKIKRNCFDSKFIDLFKSSLRVFDPSNLLIKVVSRPEEISYVDENLSKADFYGFSDFDNIVENLIKRDTEYIPLIEFGNQRANNYKMLSGTCYFEVKAFLKHQSYDIKNLEKKNSFEPFLASENKYANELPTLLDTASSFPVKDLYPLLQISYNNFRGEKDLLNANIFNDVFSELGLPSNNLLNIFKSDIQNDVQAIKWINSYTGGPSWRRCKPSSTGFTFLIKKSILLKYLQANELQLCYRINLRRSTDNDRIEKFMSWSDLQKDIVISNF